MPVKADLHVHTTYSEDSLITPKELVFYARRNGLNAVAVTDHNCLAGAFKIAKEANFPIIPGMEVSSRDGHIVALNVSELIQRNLSAEETVDKIHKAGGIAVACHPYALFKGSLGRNVSACFDAIEVINARSIPFRRSVRKAEESAATLKLPRVAGTDAHYGPQIGYGYTIIEAEPSDTEAIVSAIVRGRCSPFGQAVPVFLNLQQQLQRIRRMAGKTRQLGRAVI